MIRKAILTLILMMATAPLAGAAVFDHRAHLEEYAPGTPCDTCHRAGAPSIVPGREVCLECHDQALVDEAELPATRTHGPVWPLHHRLEAKGSAINCASCHQMDFCLECHKSGFADEMGEFGNNMINVHRGDFFVTHPVPARTDPQLCSSCHENAFCVDCHNQFGQRFQLAGPSHRLSWSSIRVGGPNGIAHAQFNASQCQICHPDSVLQSHDWTSGHAREARKNLATCQACHPEGDVCLTCHSASTGLKVNPHPSDWGGYNDRLLDSSNGRSCRKCHTPPFPPFNAK